LGLSVGTEAPTNFKFVDHRAGWLLVIEDEKTAETEKSCVCFTFYGPVCESMTLFMFLKFCYFLSDSLSRTGLLVQPSQHLSGLTMFEVRVDIGTLPRPEAKPFGL
jgi:hypothetical protein